MNREAMQAHRKYFDMVHGVTMKAIAVLSDDDLSFRPREGMRTAKELLYHMYSMDKSMPEAVRTGSSKVSSSKVRAGSRSRRRGASGRGCVSTSGSPSSSTMPPNRRSPQRQ